MNISKYKAYIPSGDKIRKKSVKIANAFAAELANYGIQVSEDLFQRVKRNKKRVAREFALNILKEYTVGNTNPPLFKNWEKRQEFTFEECVFQICGYIFQFSGNDLEDENFLNRLKEKIDFKKLKTLELASEQEVEEYAKKLFSSNVSQDKKTSQKLVKIAKFFRDIKLPKIQSDEVRISLLLAFVEDGKGLLGALNNLRCKTADVMRYAAAKKDFNQIKLPSDVIYANLSWRVRVDCFQYLNSFSFEDLCESMGINREAWFRWTRHTHLLTQKSNKTIFDRFKNLYLAAFVSLGNRLNTANSRVEKEIKSLMKSRLVEVTESGNLVYRTFASRIASAIENKDFESIKALVGKRPGYLFRNLTSISHGIKKKNEADFVDLIRGLLPKASPDVLFSILSIDNKAKYRIIDVKGNTLVEEADYGDYIRDIQRDIKSEIYKRFGFEGKVKTTPALKDNIVPFLSKNSDLPRGTRIKLENHSYLYFFVHWVQNNKERTDLDSSYLIFDKNWVHQVVAFYAQANSFITHSGDLTNAPAPNGATEYGKIRLDKIQEGVRYIVPCINVYTGSVFCENKECRAGFFTSNQSKYTINRNHVSYDLTQPAQANIPFVLDVKNKEIIVIDFNQRIREGWIAVKYADTIKKIISATNTKNFITIGKLANLLSGDDDRTDLIISNKDKGENSIRPENLFDIFQS